MDDEVSDPEGPELEPRPPLEADLVAICRRLNEQGACYVVVGGFAIIHAGYARTTGDIDLLVDASLDNEAKVFAALDFLPDHAVRQLDPGDVAKHIVCRVADEVLVDLMGLASGIDYAAASQSVIIHEIDGVAIPFASPQLLWRMKRHTHREKDAPDLLFLRQLFAAQGIAPPE